MDAAYGRPCNLCGGTSFALKFRGNLDGRATDRFSQYAWYGDILECASCGLVAEKLEHAPDEIAALISSEKYLDETIGELNLREKHHQFRTLLRIVADYATIEGAALLDAGANTGVFLDRARARGANVRGLEPSMEACQAARANFGITPINADIANAGLTPATYDIITMWDVIEHLYDPRGDLKTLLGALKPGGTIFVSTHDIGTLFARLTGRRYPMLMYQHFFHFSKQTLARMLRAAGYEVIATRPFIKSWSVPYLFGLIEKNWPGSAAGRASDSLARSAARSRLISAVRLPMPLREFFVIAARRP